MTAKLTLWTMLAMFCLAVGFSGCQSSKIAYGNSYYFKQTPRAVTPPTARQKANLKASLEKQGLTEESLTTKMTEAREQLDEVVAKGEGSAFQNSVARTQQLAREMKGEQLTRKEVRGKRKELRQELRTLAKEFRNAAPEETNAMDQKLKVSLILLGVGLVLLIIGAYVPIIGLIGVLSMLAGLVFLIIWLATEA